MGSTFKSRFLRSTGIHSSKTRFHISISCFAYNELIEFIGTDNQLTGIVAVGAANEAPPKRPRKALRDVVEYR